MCVNVGIHAMKYTNTVPYFPLIIYSYRLIEWLYGVCFPTVYGCLDFI